MFDAYKKKLEMLEANVPKIFKSAANNGVKNFINVAVKETTRQGLVDTSNYRRNWTAQAGQTTDETYINVLNPVEYASHLEYGHRVKGRAEKAKGHFVGTFALRDTEAYCLLWLHSQIEALHLAKKYNITKTEAERYLKE